MGAAAETGDDVWTGGVSGHAPSDEDSDDELPDPDLAPGAWKMGLAAGAAAGGGGAVRGRKKKKKKKGGKKAPGDALAGVGDASASAAMSGERGTLLCFCHPSP